MNALSINIPANFVQTAIHLSAVLRRPDRYRAPAVLDRQTVDGLWWAIKFVSKLCTPCMSDRELKHAIRLTHFRGSVCPEFKA